MDTSQQHLSGPPPATLQQHLQPACGLGDGLAACGGRKHTPSTPTPHPPTHPPPTQSAS